MRPIKSDPKPRKAPKNNDFLSVLCASSLVAPDAPQNRLVTTLMLAAEALAQRQDDTVPPVPARSHKGARPALLQDFGGLCRLIGQIQTEIAHEPEWQELLSRLYDAFGDGETLWALFHNLFPDTRTQATEAARKSPLSEREREVLRAASGDRSYQEIADQLGISRRTVDVHFENVYRKLGVHRPMQAVARAVVLGYLDLDCFDLIRNLGGSSFRDNGPFNTMMYAVGDLNREPHTGSWRPVALFGLLLLLLSGQAAALESYDPQNLAFRGQGLLYEMDSAGRILRALEPQGLRGCCFIAVAPPQAAQHGFRPGHLFAVHQTRSQYGMNLAEILELTPDGQIVRAFCGGEEIRLRLFDPFAPLFHPDGRLLVPSGSMTDAILAFSDNGRKVERFAEGCCSQVCLGPGGNLYATQSSSMGCRVQVLSPRGEPLQTFGGTPAGIYYEGLAVDSRGHVFVHRSEQGHRSMEEYDRQGECVRVFPIPASSGRECYIDARDRLYIPCERTQEIGILSLDGRMERRIDLRGKMAPIGMTIEANGRFWVSGLKVGTIS